MHHWHGALEGSVECMRNSWPRQCARIQSDPLPFPEAPASADYGESRPDGRILCLRLQSARIL